MKNGLLFTLFLLLSTILVIISIMSINPIAIILCIISVILTAKYMAKINLQKVEQAAKDIGALMGYKALHVDGLPNINRNAMCELFAFEDKLLIKAVGSEFTLKYEQITQIENISEQDIIEKQKSVGGRRLLDWCFWDH